MKILLIFTLVFCTIHSIHSQYDWAVQSSGSSQTLPGDLAIDTHENVFIVGNLSDGCQFEDVTISNTFASTFIAKYTKEGNLLWVRAIGGNSNNNGWTIGVDKDGSAYIGGQFKHTNDLTILDFGDFQLEGTTKLSGFIAKIDANGNWLWAKALLSQDEVEIVDIGFLPDGGILYSGYTNGDIEIEGELFTIGGQRAIFFSKFDEAGNLEWFKHGEGNWGVGTSAFAPFYKHEMDGNGNSYIICKIGPDSDYEGISIAVDPGTNFVLASFDLDGNLRWTRTISSLGGEQILGGLTIDDENRVYVGVFKSGSNMIIDGVVYPDLNENQWIAKFDSEGNVLLIDGMSNTSVLDLSFHPDGYIILVGSYAPFLNISYMQNDMLGGHGTLGTYIAAFDKELNYYGVKQIAYSEDFESGKFAAREIETSSSGKSYMTGNFNRTIELGEYTLSSSVVDFTFLTRFELTNMFDLTVNSVEFENQAFDVYPNPSRGMLNIDFESSQSKQLQIYNSSGKLVHDELIENANYTFDTERLAEGMYFIRVENVTVRFIKNR